MQILKLWLKMINSLFFWTNYAMHGVEFFPLLSDTGIPQRTVQIFNKGSGYNNISHSRWSEFLSVGMSVNINKYSRTMPNIEYLLGVNINNLPDVNKNILLDVNMSQNTAAFIFSKHCQYSLKTCHNLMYWATDYLDDQWDPKQLQLFYGKLS